MRCQMVESAVGTRECGANNLKQGGPCLERSSRIQRSTFWESGKPGCALGQPWDGWEEEREGSLGRRARWEEGRNVVGANGASERLYSCSKVGE